MNEGPSRFLNLLLLVTCLCIGPCLLTGCADTREGLDSAWRTVDPAGHRRYHRDKYYPHERKVGIRLPGDAGQ
jgi:hypothetical protein